MTDSSDSTLRFTDRVADYVRSRPGYPDQVVTTLREMGVLWPGAAVADIGAGTGISSEMLLRAGCDVAAVEPNDAMRAAAEEWLGGHPGFRAVRGTAEATTLADRSIDLVLAAQAFHWFDARAARHELRRIVRPGGQLALLWNSRETDTTPFLGEYEAMLHRFGTDYATVVHRNITPAQLAAFFGGPYRTFTFPNAQALDRNGLVSRVLSSSYTPAEADPRRAPLLAELHRIWAAHQVEARVEIRYETELHVGELG